MPIDSSDIILRWTLGKQDTVALSDFNKSKFLNFLWLAKLSIISFYRHFPNARLVLLYNGDEFDDFKQTFLDIEPKYDLPLEYIDQREQLKSGKIENPYHFYPGGVWWKWLPFRLDINKHEIAVDTDILCISEPSTWFEWIESEDEIVVAPERYETVAVNTTGDFWSHPMLVGKKPYNCGIVGQRAGSDFAERFFEVTKQVKFGHSHNSLFITEQGAINLWVRSLEMEGVNHCCLDFARNAWIRDFVYFLHKGVRVETVHAVTWHKMIAKALKKVFEARIIDGRYTDDQEFLEAILKESRDLDFIPKHIVGRQLSDSGQLENEILIPKSSF